MEDQLLNEVSEISKEGPLYALGLYLLFKFLVRPGVRKVKQHIENRKNLGA